MCEDLTRYDIKPKAFTNYLRYYGWHFSKALHDFAVSMMYKEDSNGNKIEITPYTKEKVDELLKAHNIVLKNKNTIYDYVYVANMCKADLLGDSIPDEKHLAKYIKNVIDDPDGYDGIVMTRWYADMCKKGIAIDWTSML